MFTHSTADESTLHKSENRPLRALIVEPEGQAGHWHYTLAVARALIHRGVEVKLATIFPFEPLDGTDAMAISRIGQRIQGGNGGLRHVVLRAFEHVGKVCRLIGVIREFRPDVVHLHGSLGKLDSLYFRMIRFLGARVVYTAHDLTPSRRLEVLNRLGYRAADLMIVHSTKGIADLRSYGVDESRVKWIPQISTLQLGRMEALNQEEAKDALGLPPRSRVLLFFGWITFRKGLDLLIDAHASLCHDDADIYLVIAGRPLEDLKPYQERIAASGHSGRVILDPQYVPFERMRVYFSAADIVVLPYRHIYQSGVLQWAYAFGRPVVVTNVGGVGEAVNTDGTGLVAEIANGEGLAHAISRLLSDGELARTMGSRGLQLARTKYSDEAVSEELENIYRHLVRNGRS